LTFSNNLDMDTLYSPKLILSMKAAAILVLSIYLMMALPACAQRVAAKDEHDTTSPNTLDLQLFGNRGFFSFGYNRKMAERGHFSLLMGPAIGLVPGSHDSLSSSPAYWHMNFGATLCFGFGRNELCAGSSYTRILSSGYGANRVLGEFGYIRHFPRDEFAIKLSYTPIWYDHGGDDVQYIPISFAIRATL
jgi:hypothetical protein